MQSILSLGSRLRGSSRTRHQKATSERPQAPHPLPRDFAGLTCPITGLSSADLETHPHNSAVTAFAALEADPDIIEERRPLDQVNAKAEPEPVSSVPLTQLAKLREPIRYIPLNVISRTHKANSETRRLVQNVGGLPMLRKFTNLFYQKSFVDQHLDQFIRSHDDPHGERFATWIAEKFGDGTPWTNERRTRKRDVMQIGHHVESVAFDRSSAHFAAWHSPKRSADKWGQHFKPDDARNWMRLHFWAAREVGLFEPEHIAFMDYYQRFIAHFISVYSSKSPIFTRESARWSADPKNIQRYLAAGNRMVDVIDKPLEKAFLDLPLDERRYTGNGGSDSAWPYESF